MDLREQAAGLRAQGLKQAEIASSLSISQSRVSQLLRGKTGHESRHPANNSHAVTSQDLEAARAEGRAEERARIKARFEAVWDRARETIAEQAETIERLTAERDQARADVARLLEKAPGRGDK